MKQVTGSKQPETINKVSIQQSLDGHSFSLPDLSGNFPDGSPVEVEVLTPCTMLVPSELFDEHVAHALLAANGTPAGDDESTVCSDPAQPIVAVMALPSKILRLLTEKFGGRIRFTTPLLHELPQREPTVWIYRTQGFLYIKVTDGATLQFAEVVPAANEAETLYFLERSGTEFSWKDYRLRIAGDEPKQLRKWIGKWFKETICE